MGLPMDLLFRFSNPPWVTVYLALKAGNSWGTGGGTPANAAESAAGADSAASKSLHRGA
jgi:hypothetical protein